MNSVLKVALIGLGQIAQKRYIPALRKSEEFQLVGICCRTQTTCERLGQRIGISKWTTDYATLVSDKEVDAVIVATPHPTHAEIACVALEAGKHTLIEKPLATTMEDTLTIAKYAEESDAIVMSLPFDRSQAFLTVVDLIRQGLIGKVVGIRAVADGKGPPAGCDWKYNVKSAGGGVLLASGVYGLSQIASLMGPANTVSAQLSTALQHRTSNNGKTISSDIDDQCSLSLTYETGQLVTLETRWTNDTKSGFLQIMGREGSVLLQDNGSVLIRSNRNSKESRMKKLFHRLNEKFGSPLIIQPGYKKVQAYGESQGILEHFGESIRLSKTPTANIHQAVSVTEQIVKAYESSNNNSVRVPLIHQFEPWTKLPPELFDLSSDRLRSSYYAMPRSVDSVQLNNPSILKHSEIIEFERTGFLGPFDLPQSVIEKWNTANLSSIGSRIKQQHRQVQRNQHLYSRSLVNLVTTDAILERVKALIGPDVLLWVAHVIEREPGARGVHWHVDRINMLTGSLHVSVALTDMNIENGCLRAILGSHLYRLELSGQKYLPGNEDISDMADTVAPWHAPHQVTNLEVKAGQFFFTWGGLWHAVGKNISKSSRFACVARFGRTDVCLRNYGFRDSKQWSRIPCLLVSGEDRFGMNIIQRYPQHDFLLDENYNPSIFTRFIKHNVSQFQYHLPAMKSFPTLGFTH